MRIIKHIPQWIKTQLETQHGAVLPKGTQLKILSQGTAAAIYPGITTNRTHAIRCHVGDYIAGAFYNKVPLASYWNSVGATVGLARKMIVRAAVVRTVHDLLDDINRYTCFDFTKDELEPTPIADGQYTEFSITCTDNCIWFTGALTVLLDYPIHIVEGKVITPLAIDTKVARPTVEPLGTQPRYNASMLTYDINYPDYAVLGNLVMAPGTTWDVGTPMTTADGTALATVLRKADGLPWNCTPLTNFNDLNQQIPFNIYNCTVIYNGPVEDYRFQIVRNVFKSEGFASRLTRLPRMDQTMVLVLVSGMSGSTNFLSEPIFIHYGGPRVVQEDKKPLHHWPLQNDRLNYGTSEESPDFAARGQRWHNDPMGDISLYVNFGGQGSIGGETPIGTRLPVDRDFTLYFEGRKAGSAAYVGNNIRKRANANTQYLFWGQGNAGLTGTWEVARENALPSTVAWPCGAGYALVRRGDWWFMYTNGELSQINYGKPSVDFYDTFNAPVNEVMLYRNFMYFDYGLSGDQVRKLHLPAMQGDPVRPKRELPVPVHHWPLNNSWENLGSNGTPLNPIGSFRQIADTDDAYWLYRSTSTRPALGVALPVDRDFTLTFDFITSSASTVYTGMLSGADSNAGHPLKFYGSAPFIEAGGGGNNAIADANQLRVNNVHRMQFVRRGDIVLIYINGKHFKSQYWTDNSVPNWTHFGKAVEYINSTFNFRNLRYYDEALDQQQLLDEPGVVFK